MGHIRWINVLSDVPFNRGEVSVLVCVLFVDIADDDSKVKGGVDCACSEFRDSFRADCLLGQVVKAFFPQRIEIQPGKRRDSGD